MNKRFYDINIVVPLFNKERQILLALQSIQNQILTEKLSVCISVVDDKSTDNGLKVVKALVHKPYRLFIFESCFNEGRSSAINKAVQAIASKICIILDADCVWVKVDILQRFFAKMQKGNLAVFGVTTGLNNNFWGRYYKELFDKRLKGDFESIITTANCAFDRNVLIEIGGFSADYKAYGFEDRDLYLRLIERYGPKAKIILDKTLIAENKDEPSLIEVSIKMYDAGNKTSFVISKKFPNYYRNTIFFKLDCTKKPRAFFLVARLFRPLILMLNWCIIYFFETIPIPYPVKKKLVPLVSGLSFFLGTLDRRRSG